MSGSLKRTAAAVTALLIAVMTAGLATAAPASAAAIPIDVVGISGASVTPDGTTGYTLTVPGLIPDTSYQGSVDAHNTTWRYTATATSTPAGLGTFVFTFAAPPAPGTTVYVTVRALSDATNFSNIAVTFPAFADTTPVAITGFAGATIASTSGGYLLAVPGMTPNTAYMVSTKPATITFGSWYATSDSGGLVTFKINAQKGGALPTFTKNLYVSTVSVPLSGTFTVPDIPTPPVVVIAPADDTANVVAGGQVAIPVAANDVATTDGTPIPASGLDYSLTSTPALGTATWNADHSLTYVAAAVAGVDTLTYQVCTPATRVCGQATISVTVDPILAKAPAAAPIPQVSRIPRGGVATGDGSTAGQLVVLANTGGDELPSILVGMAALTAGGLMVAGGRKRDDED